MAPDHSEHSVDMGRFKLSVEKRMEILGVIMRYFKMLGGVVLCLFLQGCWFVFIPLPAPKKRPMTWSEANDYIREKNLEAQEARDIVEIEK